MISLFSFDAVNRSGAVFDNKKLDWVNQHYIQAMAADALGEALLPYVKRREIDVSQGPALSAVADLLRDRAKTLVEMAEAAEYFYVAPDKYDEKAAKKQFKSEVAQILVAVRENLNAISDWDAESVQGALVDTVAALDIGFGKLGQPLRLAVTGGTASPALNETMALIGRESVLPRIDAAIMHCGAEPA
jgi:glutamyl-tRNA synthetase